jgi:hypothetical protein
MGSGGTCHYCQRRNCTCHLMRQFKVTKTMVVTVCDVCQNQTTPSTLTQLAINGAGIAGVKRLDLCNVCVARLTLPNVVTFAQTGTKPT